MKNNTALLVGLLAGIAAGLMVLAAINSGVLAFFLFFAAPAAVYIASMGWGTTAGIVSALTGAALAAGFGDASVAGLALLILFGPAAYVGHLANLGQRDETGKAIVWYPLSDILFRLMLVLAAGFILVGILSGYTQELATKAFAELMKQIAAANPELPNMSEEVLQDRAGLYAGMIPLVVPSVWLLMHVLTAFVSANVTRRSGLLARQPEDIAATLGLPFAAAGFPAAGLALMILASGPLKLVGGVLLGIGISGYALVGLAQMHYRTRPMPARGLILGIAYGAIILFSVPLLFFTFMGLMRSMKSQSSNNGPGSSGPNSSNQNEK